MPTDHQKRKKLCCSSCNKAKKEVLTASLSGEECVAVIYVIVMVSSPTYLSIAPGRIERYRKVGVK